MLATLLTYKRVPVANTPTDTHTSVRIPTRTPELVVSKFEPLKQQLKTEISHKASKETWPEKNQLRVEKNRPTDTTNVPQQTKELHNLIRGTACIRSFRTIAPRRDETKKNIRQELLDRLLHVTTEPSS